MLKPVFDEINSCSNQDENQSRNHKLLTPGIAGLILTDILAQRGARLFHAKDCGWVRRIPEPERAYFKRVAEAKEAGLQACPSCEPWEPA